MTEAELLDLAAICQRIERPDEEAREAARVRFEQLVAPAGSLGRVEELAVWLAGIQGHSPTRLLERVRVVVFAADHGIAASGVSASPPEATAEMLRTLVEGGAAVDAVTRLAGAELRVVDVGVEAGPAEDTDAASELSRHKIRRRSGRIDIEDALTREEAEQAFLVGVAVADAEVDAGADLLVCGDLGTGSTTPAAAIIGLVARLDAASVVGRSTGIDDNTWMRKCAAIRDAMRRGRPVVADPLQILATVGGTDLAAMTGFLLQAAARRTPVILDGVVSAACALLAHRICFRAADWWVAGHSSDDPAHKTALRRLSLSPILDLGVRLNDGTAAVLAVPLLQAAAATLAETSTLAEAAVSPPIRASQDDDTRS